ncbi:hypothetical protein [Bacillus timonensis]|nr:hypothetical protein [Bacillus timonensis]
MNLAALLIAVFFFIALLIALLLGTPEQRNIVIDCIEEILETIG